MVHHAYRRFLYKITPIEDTKNKSYSSKNTLLPVTI